MACFGATKSSCFCRDSSYEKHQTTLAGFQTMRKMHNELLCIALAHGNFGTVPAGLRCWQSLIHIVVYIWFYPPLYLFICVVNANWCETGDLLFNLLPLLGRCHQQQIRTRTKYCKWLGHTQDKILELLCKIVKISVAMFCWSSVLAVLSTGIDAHGWHCKHNLLMCQRRYVFCKFQQISTLWLIILN